MTSEVPATTVNTQLVQGSKPPPAATGSQNSGKPTPPGGNPPPAYGAVDAASGRSSIPPPKVTSAPKKTPSEPPKRPPDLHAVVAQLNKHLQNTGRPNTYKLDSSAGHSVIQEINPETQQVIGEIPAAEFKALAQELGISGQLIDTKA